MACAVCFLSRLLCDTGWQTDTYDRRCLFSPKMQKKVNACDFSYFCSIAAPEAPEEKLRTMCDWGNWVGLRHHISPLMLTLSTGVSL